MSKELKIYPRGTEKLTELAEKCGLSWGVDQDTNKIVYVIEDQELYEKTKNTSKFQLLVKEYNRVVRTPLSPELRSLIGNYREIHKEMKKGNMKKATKLLDEMKARRGEDE